MSNQPRLSVCYVLRKFPVLSETFILNEILGLEALGVDVNIFSIERPNDPRFHAGLARLKAPVVYMPGSDELQTLLKSHGRVKTRHPEGYRKTLMTVMKHPHPSLFWRFLQACWLVDRSRRSHPDHFHAHFATRPTSVACLAGSITGLPYSFTAHAMDIFKEQLSRKALSRKIEGSKFVVTVSDFNRTFLREVTPKADAKVVRINNGIDVERFAPNGTVPADPFTILCVARLVEKKGHSILLDAFAELRDRGVEFRGWLVGKGKLRWEIEQQIKRLKLRKHVELLGPHTHDEVRDRYHDANLYVLPCTVGSDGNRDGLPVSIIEALSCGVPVVTTPMTGIPEVIRDRFNGLLVPDGDAHALADAIEVVIRDAPLYDKLQSNARASVVSAFDSRKTVIELRDLFAGDRG